MKNFMEEALNLAKKAFRKGEVPIGAVIVKNGKIIAKGFNKREKSQNAIKHAEIIAIEKACKKEKSWRLEDCDIYVTLEPCAMCATAISFARIKNIYYAADDEKGGGINHNAKIYDTDRHLWKPHVVKVSDFSEESSELLKEFFSERRKIKNGA